MPEIDRLMAMAVPKGVGRPSLPKSTLAAGAVTLSGSVRSRSCTGLSALVRSYTRTFVPSVASRITVLRLMASL